RTRDSPKNEGQPPTTRSRVPHTKDNQGQNKGHKLTARAPWRLPAGGVLCRGENYPNEGHAAPARPGPRPFDDNRMSPAATGTATPDWYSGAGVPEVRAGPGLHTCAQCSP